MTDSDAQLVALAIVQELDDCLAAVKASEDEEVRLRLVDQMTVLLRGIRTLVDVDGGGFVDDLGDFYAWADENGVEVHG